MRSADEEKLRELAATVAADAGFDLEELTIVSAGRRRIVRVVVDGDGGVALDAAAQVSRALSVALDSPDHDVFGDQPYTLEVSSPGIGRPLTEPRHWRRARGRLVTVKRLDGGTVQGRVRRLVEAPGERDVPSGAVGAEGTDGTDATVELLVGDAADILLLPLAEVRKAKVDVEFGDIPDSHAAVLVADGFVDPARAGDAEDGVGEEGAEDDDDLDDTDADFADTDAEDTDAEDTDAEDTDAEDTDAEDTDAEDTDARHGDPVDGTTDDRSAYGQPAAPLSSDIAENQDEQEDDRK